jgi:hypothetical protein
MILTENPRYWFYPDISGNLALKEDEQVAVEIIRPTGFMSSEFKKTVTRTEYYPDDQPLDEDGNYKTPKKLRSLTVEIKFNSELILRSCVGEIKNLSVEGVDGKNREIKNGKELAECRAYGVSQLIDAITVEVSKDSISNSKKKNIA